MGQPLRPAPRPERWQPPSSQNEDRIIDKLATRIADEEDDRARQRLDEMFNPQKYWTRKQNRANMIGIWICVSVFALVAVFLIYLLNKPFTGAYN